LEVQYHTPTAPTALHAIMFTYVLKTRVVSADNKEGHFEVLNVICSK